MKPTFYSEISEGAYFLYKRLTLFVLKYTVVEVLPRLSSLNINNKKVHFIKRMNKKSFELNQFNHE